MYEDKDYEKLLFPLREWFQENYPEEMKDTEIYLRHAQTVCGNNCIALYVIMPEGHLQYNIESDFPAYMNSEMTIEEIGNHLIDVIIARRTLPSDNTIVHNFKKIKKYIKCGTIKCSNQEYLNSIPHAPTEQEDVYLIYAIRMPDPKVGSMTITNHMMEQWGITFNQLCNTVIKNELKNLLNPRKE